MTLSAEGYFSWALPHPGNERKVYPGRNANQGIVWHSAEGWLPYLLGYVAGPTGASWTGSIALDGRLYQHYPVTAKCWASGNAVANGQYWSFELEGVQGNPATPEQVETCLRIAAEFEAFTGLVATRTGFPRTMWEHNEVAEIAAPNAGPTSCPSHRYDPFFAALDTEDGMTPEETKRMVAEMVFGSQARYDELVGLGVVPLESRVVQLEAGGDTVARAAIAKHEDGHGMVNVPTFNSITITGVGLQVEEED